MCGVKTHVVARRYEDGAIGNFAYRKWVLIVSKNCCTQRYFKLIANENLNSIRSFKRLFLQHTCKRDLDDRSIEDRRLSTFATAMNIFNMRAREHQKANRPRSPRKCRYRRWRSALRFEREYLDWR